MQTDSDHLDKPVETSTDPSGESETDDIVGLMRIAPSGTEVSVGLMPSKEGDDRGYAIQLATKREGADPLVTLFGITKETFGTVLVLMMELPGGLQIPGIGTVQMMPQPEDANLDSGPDSPPAK